jgi:hypothetical protein
MNPSVISALAAPAGATIGGLTSVLASWLGQHAQAKAQWLAQDKLRRQELYKEFIEAASKCNIHALYWQWIKLHSRTPSASRAKRSLGQKYRFPKKLIQDAERLLNMYDSAWKTILASNSNLMPNHTARAYHCLGWAPTSERAALAQRKSEPTLRRKLAD